MLSKNPKVITILSGKGGVGKTVTAINLASAIHKLGKNVVLVDSNLTTPNIALNLGAPVIPISLNHVLSGKKHISDALYEHHSGIKIVPASLSLKDLKDIKPELFKKAIKNLKGYADIILIDSAAGLGREALLPLMPADELLIVTNPETAALTGALKTIKIAEQFNKKVSIVLTKIKKGRKEISTKDVKTILEQQILARIPEDDAVRESLLLRDAVVNTHPKSRAAKSYMKLGAKIINVAYKENNGQEKTSQNQGNFLRRIFGWMLNN